MINKNPLIIFVDVDDTIVRSFGTKRIKIPSVIAHIKMLHEQGVVLYCWSSGGAVYAKESADEFGISDCFSGFLPKPNVLIDDQLTSEWRNFIEIGPSEISSEGDAGYRAKIEVKYPAVRIP